jgi:DNA-binding CsgD family transcriptional regulator
MTRAISARELAEAIRAVAAGFRVVMADPPAPRPGGRAPDGRTADGRTADGRTADGRTADGRTPPDGRTADGRTASHPGDPGAPGREGSRRPGGMLDPVHSPGQPERDDHAELLLRSLSERERQVLALLVRGYSNRRIADTCFLSLNTVRTHVQNVLVKLGVHSKLEAAALAVRQGLVSIEDPVT